MGGDVADDSPTQTRRLIVSYLVSHQLRFGGLVRSRSWKSCAFKGNLWAPTCFLFSRVDQLTTSIVVVIIIIIFFFITCYIQQVGDGCPRNLLAKSAQLDVAWSSQDSLIGNKVSINFACMRKIRPRLPWICLYRCLFLQSIWELDVFPARFLRLDVRHVGHTPGESPCSNFCRPISLRMNQPGGNFP